MTLPRILLLVSLFLSPHLFAQIQITSITGASNHNLGNASTDVIIYGGIAGDGTGCAPDTSLCDNCVVPDQACNRVRIQPETVLRIEFTVTADITGTAYVFAGYNSNGTKLPFADESELVDKTQNALVKNSTGFVALKWGALCALAGDNTCNNDPGTIPTVPIFLSVEGTAAFATNTITLSVRILNPDADPGEDQNLLACNHVAPSAGVCALTAYPGDEKVYIIDPERSAANTCPTTFDFVRVFYSTNSFAEATYTSDNFVDLDIGTNCEPSGEWIIDGLANDQLHFFRPSIVDVAQNNVFLVDTADITADADCNSSPPDDQGCPFTATPSNVLGLLTEDFNCFISTAAYGSGFASQVETFRKFRNQFLLTNKWGRQFVKLYYAYGPKAAHFISDKPWLRAATRVALVPFFALAWLSLHCGLAVASLLIFLAFGLSLGAVIYGVRRWRRSPA